MAADPVRAGGAAGAAPAVVCLHASASSPRQWRALAETLGGRRMLAPELIGYGSAPDWSYEQPLSLDDEARRIEPLIAAEPGGVHLVGHSFGAAVALRLAVRNPQRVLSVAVYEPVLFSLLHEAATDLGGPSRAGLEIASVRIAIRRAVYSGRAAMAARLFVDYWSGAGAWERLDERRQAAVVGCMRKVDAEFDAAFCNAMPLAAYRRVATPVLLLAGGRTRRPTRRIAELLAGVLPDVARGELPGAGHMGPISHAAEVNAQIAAFLEAHRERVALARAA